jgi:hypothetical protein
VDEVALIRDTISHYAPVLIAPLSIQIRRAGVQKKFGPERGAVVTEPPLGRTDAPAGGASGIAASVIGTFVSSGCIRLTNEDVTDLYTRALGPPPFVMAR